MVNYVILTHYHLLYATLHALTKNEKCRIWISKEYSSFSKDIESKLLSVGPFEEVTVFETAPIYQEFFQSLSYNEDDYAFNTVLENHFSNIFGDISDDIFYIFNEYQLSFAYIEKYCKHFNLIEDGYKSYEQQKHLLCFKGQFSSITSRIGTYFPKTFGLSDKFNRYTVNEYPKSVLKQHVGKIDVLDYNDMEINYYDTMHKICKVVYKYSSIDHENDCTLVLTQPLARAKYCMYSNQFLLYKDIVEREVSQGKHVYIKPHPADILSYSPLQSEKVTLLSKDFPVEVYNYESVKFSKVINYGSTAAGISKYSDNIVSINANRKATRNQIVRDIINRTYKSKVKLLLVLNVSEESNNIKKYIRTILNIKEFDIQIVNYGFELSYNSSRFSNFEDIVNQDEILEYCVNNYDFNYIVTSYSKGRISKMDLLKLHYLQFRAINDIYVVKGQKRFRINNLQHTFGMFNVLSLIDRSNIFISKKIASDLVRDNKTSLLDYYLENEIKVSYLDSTEAMNLLDFFGYEHHEQLSTLIEKHISLQSELEGDKKKLHFEMLLSLLRMARILELEKYSEYLSNIDMQAYFEMTEDCQLINNSVLGTGYSISNLFYALFYKLRIRKVITFLKKNGWYKKTRKKMKI